MRRGKLGKKLIQKQDNQTNREIRTQSSVKAFGSLMERSYPAGYPVIQLSSGRSSFLMDHTASCTGKVFFSVWYQSISFLRGQCLRPEVS